MSHKFKTGSKWRTSSPAYFFCSLSNISKYQLGASAQILQQYSGQGHVIDLQRYGAASNLIEQIKAPIFLEVVLPIETM